MNIARVIGTVWATRKVRVLEGYRMLVIQPMTGERKPAGDPIVAVDSVGAGVGELVFFVTASEAVIPLDVDRAPIDATITGILDRIDIQGETEWVKWRDEGSGGNTEKES
jgi:ethanolamine utilization protein EutN